MQRVVVLFATVAVLLTGCMLGPDYQRPALPVPEQHRDAEPPAPGREAVSLADVQWFALFQDERLQALIQTALANNYDMRIAAARVLEAAAQLGVTRSFLLPTVDGTAAVSRDRVSEESFSPTSRGFPRKQYLCSWVSPSPGRSISGAAYVARPRQPAPSYSPPSGPSALSWSR